MLKELVDLAAKTLVLSNSVIKLAVTRLLLVIVVFNKKPLQFTAKI
jgi:hypothetical protein